MLALLGHVMATLVSWRVADVTHEVGVGSTHSIVSALPPHGKDACCGDGKPTVLASCALLSTPTHSQLR